jgi:hypothetical protein
MIIKDFDKKKLEELKEATKVVDGMPLIKALSELQDNNIGNGEKIEIGEAIRRGAERAGNLALERAFMEKLLSEQEWEEMKNKGFEIIDMGTILLPYFESHKRKAEKVKIVTGQDSIIYKHKDFIKERFGLEVITPIEMIEVLKNEPSEVCGIEPERK